MAALDSDFWEAVVAAGACCADNFLTCRSRYGDPSVSLEVGGPLRS